MLIEKKCKNTEAASWFQMFYKKGALQSFGKFTERNLYWNFRFNKVLCLRPPAFSKRNFGTCIFLQILLNFSEHVLSLNNCEQLVLRLRSITNLFTVSMVLYLQKRMLHDYLCLGWKMWVENILQNICSETFLSNLWKNTLKKSISLQRQHRKSGTMPKINGVTGSCFSLVWFQIYLYFKKITL